MSATLGYVDRSKLGGDEWLGTFLSSLSPKDASACKIYSAGTGEVNPLGIS